MADFADLARTTLARNRFMVLGTVDPVRSAKGVAGVVFAGRLAEQYKQWSLGVQVQWPRTARILRAIAESYERDAVREDVRAQLDQDLD